jgi:hypothetical protein
MPKRLSRAVVAAVSTAKIIGIKAGDRSDHKFTGVWPVVVGGRVYARSWTLKKDGWYQVKADSVRSRQSVVKSSQSTVVSSVFSRQSRTATAD